MSKMKSAMLLFLLLCLLLPLAALPCSAQEAIAAPTVSAKSALLMEAESGRIIAAKNADTPLPMASTTKVMTALVALELAAPDTLITVDPAAVGVEGSSIYLVENEQLTLEELLYALMLESANDAATAIAIGLSGSVEAFAAQMNRKAIDLGLTKTHFTNPHGLDHEEHYTTAYELAVITREALQNALFCKIVSTRKTTIPHAGADGVRLLINHNKLLRLYEACIGVKTGFTKRSGRCLISAAERDGVKLIAVTLSAPDDWNDHMSLLEYGFSRYTSVLLCEKEELLFPLSTVSGSDDYVMLSNPEELRVTLPKEHTTITKTIELPRFAFAPVAANETMGRVVYRSDINGDGKPEVIAEAPLRACYTVELYRPRRSFWQWLRELLGF